MRLLFLLSGEHQGLAREEVLGLLRSYGDVKEVERDDQILVAEFIGDLSALKRLAFTHEVCRFVASCDVEELDAIFREMEIPSGYTCVRVRKIGRRWEGINSIELERRMGEIIWRRGAKISVSNPDVVIRVYLAKRAYVGFLIHETDRRQFNERRPDRRPFTMPFVLLPRLARALINVTGVRGNLLDPMCGTGTFLIEAGLMGLRFVGVDVFRKVVYGCARNLRHFGLPQNVVMADARNLPFRDESFDSVVTDFPYLRSAKGFGEDLYERATEEISRVLKRGRRAVLVINFDADDIFGRHLRIEAKLYQRVHKSLTRRFFICRKV